jgi:hypothetical protein
MATVLITYYAPSRMRDLAPQVRNVLKCAWVERLIVLNHNPGVTIGDFGVADPRLVVVNHSERRGCGHRWVVASRFEFEYLVVVDDDLHLFSWQLNRLFGHLLDAPEAPHGLSGMRVGDDGSLSFHQRQNMTVDLLCEVYAVTRPHVERYIALSDMLTRDPKLSDLLEWSCDFVVISHAGRGRPRIHREGRIARSRSFNEPGTAVHQASAFSGGVTTTLRAVRDADARAGLQASAG